MSDRRTDLHLQKSKKKKKKVFRPHPSRTLMFIEAKILPKNKFLRELCGPSGQLERSNVNRWLGQALGWACKNQDSSSKKKMALNLSEYTPRFTTVRHEKYPERMQYLNVTLTHPTLGELATARCLQIHSRMKFKSAGDFLEIMDEDSREMSNFSVGLFDKYSNVRPWLVEKAARGVGVRSWALEICCILRKWMLRRRYVLFFPLLFLLCIYGLFSSLGDVVSARGFSRRYWLHLIWDTEAMLSVGQHQLDLRVARPNGWENGPPLLPFIVK